MFEALPASFPAAAPSRARAVTPALLLHAVLIGVAVMSTASSGTSPAPVARDTIRVNLAIVEQRTHGAQAAAPPPLAIPSAPTMSNTPTISPALDLPRIDIPGPVTAAPRATPRAGPGTMSFGVADSTPSPFHASEVDELPRLVSDLHPEYPAALRRAGVSGKVTVEYVVGMDGRVDSASMRVLTTDHHGFAASVVRALHGARFKAARRGRQPVAVLVQQTIRFRSEMP